MDSIFVVKLVGQNKIQFTKTGFFHLIWMNEGKATLTTDKKLIPFKKKEIFMVLPDTELEISTNENSEIFWLYFPISTVQSESKEFALDVFRLFVYQYKTNSVSVHLLESIQINAEMMWNEIQSEKPSVYIIHSYLRIILFTLIRENKLQLSIPDKNIERIQDFFSLVHDFAVTEKRVTFYAGKLHISTKRLNQILQGLTHKSASFFIQEHLILEAKKRLINGKLTVNEIAYELGFDDRSYFSKFFKKWVGVAPEKYKLSYLNNKEEKIFKDGLMNYLV